MGICASCEAAAVGPMATAKVVLHDGELREFDRPVRASHVLQKDHAAYFVCDADEMEFDQFVSAVGSDEDLLPGNLYFVLPRSMLKRPLHAEELGALALKASAALVRGKGRSSAAAVRPLVFAESGAAAPAAEGKGRVRNGRGRNFTANLRAIPE